jgi:hypothetical protein
MTVTVEPCKQGPSQKMELPGSAPSIIRVKYMDKQCETIFYTGFDKLHGVRRPCALRQLHLCVQNKKLMF